MSNDIDSREVPRKVHRAGHPQGIAVYDGPDREGPVHDDRAFAFMIGAVVTVAAIWAGVAVIAAVADLKTGTVGEAGLALLAALALVLVIGGAFAVGRSSGDRAFAYLVAALLAIGLIWAVIAIITEVADLEAGAAGRVGLGLLAGLGVPVLVGIVVVGNDDDRAFGYFLTVLWAGALAWALVAVFTAVGQVEPEVAQRVGYGLLLGIPLLAGALIAIKRDAKEERLRSERD